MKDAASRSSPPNALRRVKKGRGTSPAAGLVGKAEKNEGENELSDGTRPKRRGTNGATSLLNPIGKRCYGTQRGTSITSNRGKPKTNLILDVTPPVSCNAKRDETSRGDKRDPTEPKDKTALKRLASLLRE